MARPSQNIDQRLLDAGLDLLPHTGCRGLSARRLAEHAGVNPGMFHYHFRNKETFIRTLLERLYEQMFSMLVIKAAAAETPVGNLRNALQVLAQFSHLHRQLLLRIAADALAGEAVAFEFLRTNVPRHVGILASLIAAAQRDGLIVAAPVPQVIAFLGGAVIAPVLVGATVLERGAVPAPLAAMFDSAVLSEQAAAQRIEFAIRGLTPPNGSES